MEDKIRRREVCGKLFDGWMKRQRDNVQRRINILENNIRQDLRRITHYDREQIERLINGTDHPSRVRAIYAEVSIIIKLFVLKSERNCQFFFNFFFVCVNRIVVLLLNSFVSLYPFEKHGWEIAK